MSLKQDFLVWATAGGVDPMEASKDWEYWGQRIDNFNNSKGDFVVTDLFGDKIIGYRPAPGQPLEFRP